MLARLVTAAFLTSFAVTPAAADSHRERDHIFFKQPDREHHCRNGRVWSDRHGCVYRRSEHNPPWVRRDDTQGEVFRRDRRGDNDLRRLIDLFD